MKKLLFACVVFAVALVGQPMEADDRVAYCPHVYAAISATQVAIAQCYTYYEPGDELVACVQGGNAALSALANELSTCTWQQDGGH